VVAEIVARSGLILIIFKKYSHHDLLKDWMCSERGKESRKTPRFITRASRRMELPLL